MPDYSDLPYLYWDWLVDPVWTDNEEARREWLRRLLLPPY